MKAFLRDLALTATLFGAAGAFAGSHEGGHAMHEMKHGAIQIQHPYARAVPPGQPNSAAFMTLRNMGDADNAVVSASSPEAKVVELHTHTMEDGMMKMRRIEKIAIPAKGETVLKPGGLHIMLIGLKQQLKPGMKVSLTLNFTDGSETTVEAPVQQVMKMMEQQMDGHHMSH